MKLEDVKTEFEKYIMNLDNNIVYREKLINHLNYNLTWKRLRSLDVFDYVDRYFSLKGKGFYLKLQEDGYEILKSNSGNRDAFSNVHFHLKKFMILAGIINIVEKIQ